MFEKKVAIGGVFLVIIGLILVVSAVIVAGNLPSAYNTFLGIPYSVNSNFVSQFDEMVVLAISGTLLCGIGLGVVLTAGYLGRLKKEIPQAPQPLQQPKIYCSSCGTENSVEATFCFKCGKKIARA